MLMQTGPHSHCSPLSVPYLLYVFASSICKADATNLAVHDLLSGLRFIFETFSFAKQARSSSAMQYIKYSGAIQSIHKYFMKYKLRSYLP